MKYKFLPQSAHVEALIKAAVAALPHLPRPDKSLMEDALAEFETIVAPTTWSVHDIDMDDEYSLSKDEKLEVLKRFKRKYSCAESDWLWLNELSQEVAKERNLHSDAETRAREFALKAHGSQMYGDRPYAYHLEMVANTVRENGGTHNQIIAAWLHDTIEDTDATPETIEALFGTEVAHLVWAVTSVGETRQEQMESTIAKLRETPEARLIKLADRYCNVSCCIAEGKLNLLKMYSKEHETLSTVFNVCPLLQRLHGKIEECQRLIQD